MRNGESEDKRLAVDTNSRKNKINFASSKKIVQESRVSKHGEWRGKVKFVISRSDDDVNEEGNVMFVLKNHWTFLMLQHDIMTFASTIYLSMMLEIFNLKWILFFIYNFI